jgi:hypothetical protein
MNAIPEELTGLGSKSQSDPAPVKPESTKAPFTSQRTTWFESYDEEWEAFLAENLIKRGRSSEYKKAADSLPCVWNEPPE